MAAPGTPTLAMLWEPDDPRTALRSRFGHADPAAAVAWLADVLAQHWDVEATGCERIVISDHNALAWLSTHEGRLLAKWSVVAQRFARLAATARLVAWVGAQGVPVSALIPARDGRLQVEVDHVSLGLQREVVGELLDVGDPTQVRAAGATLARLQHALAAYDEPAQVVPDPGPATRLAARIGDWLEHRAAHVPPEARDTLRELVGRAPDDELPRQLVHHDVRSANVLWAGGEVAAVLDFEEVRLDHAVAELARTSVLLGTRFREWGPVGPEVRAELRAGYESVRPLDTVEDAWWDALVLWYSLGMVPPGDDPTGWRDAALVEVDRVRRR